MPRVVSIFRTGTRQFLAYAFFLFILPVAFIALVSGLEQPKEPSSRAARELAERQATSTFAFPAAPGTHKVVRVISGDSLDVRAPGRGVERVALACVNAPKIGQMFARNSRRKLFDRIAGRIVRIREIGRDASGVPLVELLSSDEDINLWMLSNGYAWKTPSANCKAPYTDAERAARDRFAGLWQEINPIPPWRWSKS
ncbi:MAG: thermonuclease family protein [Pseudomonadota bacterium]